jgi:hypothetical protein
LVLTQPPLHSMNGATQAKSQAPPAHVGVALLGGVQTVSQSPQCEVLFETSTQEPPQLVVLPPQSTPHLPSRQTSALPHAVAQLPQCAASDVTSTHSPPHLVYPKLHVTPQPSGPQKLPPFGLVPQLAPHALQFVMLSSLMQAPLQGLKPASQAMPQPSASQVAEPLGTEVQAVSHPPQWAGSWAVSMQAPPQLLRSSGQSVTQLPSAHTCSVAHAFSQPPQWLGLVLVSTHAEPHSAKPGAQLTLHLPSSHAAMPLAGASHAASHAPQF